MTNLRAVTFVLIGISILVFGCAEHAPTATESPKIEAERPNEGSRSSKRVFVGRDSAGIVLEGHLTGSRKTRPDRCGTDETVSFSGTGQVTHLGKTDAKLSHCYNASTSDITDGELTLTGRTGGALEGTYEGELAQGSGTFSVEVTINGGSIQATMVNPEEGKATLSGSMDSGGDFKATLSGWLLHHLRDDLID